MWAALTLKSAHRLPDLILRSAQRARLEGWRQIPASVAILRDAMLRMAPQDKEA
jgi:hypothetical protein